MLSMAQNTEITYGVVSLFARTATKLAYWFEDKFLCSVEFYLLILFL